MECLPQTLDDASESFANMTKCIAKIYFHDLCSFTASSNYCFCFHCFNRGTIATEITKLQKKNKKTVKNQKPWKPQSHSRGCKNTSRVDVETLCLSLLRTEELTNQCRLEILRGGLKETGTTTEHLKWWRIEMLQRWTVFSFFFANQSYIRFNPENWAEVFLAVSVHPEILHQIMTLSEESICGGRLSVCCWWVFYHLTYCELVISCVVGLLLPV